MGSNPTSDRASGDTNSGIAFGRGIDWVLGGVLVVLGILGGFSGYVMNRAVERQWVADAIRNGEFRSEALTESEVIHVAVGLGERGAIGLIAVGVLFVVAGTGVVYLHGRTRTKGAHSLPRMIPCLVMNSVSVFSPKVLSESY